MHNRIFLSLFLLLFLASCGVKKTSNDSDQSTNSSFGNVAEVTSVERRADKAPNFSWKDESGKTISLDYSFDVNKVLFLQTDYKNIKSLYDQIVKKHAEQVILKR